MILTERASAAGEDFLMIPHIKITGKLPKPFIAKTYGFIVKVLPEHKDDKFILAHELEHVKQWYICLVAILIVLGGVVYAIPPLWPLLGLALFADWALYKFVRPYRQWAEVQGHKAQISKQWPVKTLAKLLAANYDLGITEGKALELLK